MKAMQALIGVLIISLLSLTVLSITPAAEPQAAESTWHATWAIHPRTLEEAKRLASEVIVAQVSAVRQGPYIVAPAAREPSGELPWPTQRITLRVLHVLKGNPGQTITLYHDGADTQFFEGDPPYREDEIYVLFIRPKKDEPGTYLLIAPEGRYRVVNGTLEPMVEYGLATEMQGISVVALEEKLVHGVDE